MPVNARIRFYLCERKTDHRFRPRICHDHALSRVRLSSLRYEQDALPQLLAEYSHPYPRGIVAFARKSGSSLRRRSRLGHLRLTLRFAG
jgi:hypothetical protein